MRTIDVSLRISPSMLTWPNDPGVELTPQQRIARGDAANVSQLTLGTHTGTHVDPPFHFVDGAAAVDELSPDVLIGDAVVVDARGRAGELTPHDMDALRVPRDAQRVLLRTDNSELWTRDHVEFPDTYTCLSPDAAQWVVDRGIRLIGVDFLSVERKGAPGHPTHVTLLRAGVVIVEGLDLSNVEPGAYRLVCLPLKIAGGDGAPARAVLQTD